ncbi:MAG: hypothetical protein JJ892_01760 [Balneola sp.]|nr:hypothetical protein [Balneola sp.]MBO6651499.1 hypothetical protein [Balneola sp.]MBO6710290.1 hypothetical protein [Balneola sp.]MBO6798975.1 hypothetical protein [Balneola sp.]MBO6870089.1 hypothetical protein [Balneola sp.]
MLKILADQNIYKLSQFLPDEIELTTYNNSDPIPSLNGYDALIASTVTKLNEFTIPSIPQSLKAIGTASSGSDHIDAQYFQNNGVKVFDAKGCNAKTVGEYIITVLILWSIKKNKNPEDYTVGVIGAGATGSEVKKQLQEFNIPFKMYDPPKELTHEEFNSASLQEILDCDILTFHVPLTEGKPNSTFHWLDKDKLNSSSFELIINAARGGVIDESALLDALATGSVKDVVIDVWENEPDFNTELAKKAFISTPHMAGHSEQGKLIASGIICDKIGSVLGFKSNPADSMLIKKEQAISDLNYTLLNLILRLHPIREYDADIRNICSRPDKAILFQKLRTDRPYRYEYPYISLDKTLLDEFKVLKKLGVKPLANT